MPVYQTVLAGCPEGQTGIDLICLFVPTHTDLGIHLLGYVFLGTMLLGASLSLVSWCRQ